MVESVSANQRYVVTLTAGLGWTVGMILLPVVSYLVPNWRVQQLVIAAPFVLLLGLTLCVAPSSSSWPGSFFHRAEKINSLTTLLLIRIFSN